MKRLIHLLITLGILAGFGYVLWLGVRKQREKPAEAAAGSEAHAAEEAAPEEFVVMLEKKKAMALAIGKEQPQKMELQARRMAFGIVMDPSPLIALDSSVAAAAAAFNASKSENDRTQALVATNDASKKTAEATAAQFLADKIKVEDLARSAQLQWGPVFDSDATKRRTFMEELVSGTAALIRVDVMPGDALTELPKSARIVVMGREDKPFSTTIIIPATAADPKTQAQGFILRVDKPPFTLRPGMALTSWVGLPEKPRPGYAIPRSAVLRHNGRTWVYVQEEAEKYVRKPIALDSPLDGDEGWFITENGGLTADDVVVVVGAASLLGEELNAQGGGKPE